MDIFWGRQALGCHIIYYALFLATLHEGMLNSLVYLSSHVESLSLLSGETGCVYAAQGMS